MHYAANPNYRAVTKARANKRKKEKGVENMVALYRYLTKHPCIDCGEDDIIVLDFDHRDAATKDKGVSVLARSGKSWKRVEAEIAKCEVRCSNCHRRKTAKQFGYYKLLDLIDKETMVGDPAINRAS